MKNLVMSPFQSSFVPKQRVTFSRWYRLITPKRSQTHKRFKIFCAAPTGNKKAQQLKKVEQLLDEEPFEYYDDSKNYENENQNGSKRKKSTRNEKQFYKDEDDSLLDEEDEDDDEDIKDYVWEGDDDDEEDEDDDENNGFPSFDFQNGEDEDDKEYDNVQPRYKKGSRKASQKGGDSRSPGLSYLSLDDIPEQPFDRQARIENMFKNKKPKVKYLNAFTRRYSGIVTEAHLKATFRKAVGQKIGDVRVLKINLSRIGKPVQQVAKSMGDTIILPKQLLSDTEQEIEDFEQEEKRKKQKKRKQDDDKQKEGIHILQYEITEEFAARLKRWRFGEVDQADEERVPWVKQSQIPQLVEPITITEKLTALYMKEVREGRCPPYICPVCRMPFASTKSLMTHFGSKHSLKCALCGKLFRRLEDLLRHLQVMELPYGGRLMEAILAEFMVSSSLARYGSEKLQSPKGPFSSQVVVPDLRGQVKQKLMKKAQTNRLLSRASPNQALDDLIERISSQRAELLLLPRKKSFTNKQRKKNAKDTEGSKILNLVEEESRLACDFDSVVEDWAEIPDDLKFGRNPRLFEISKKCVLLARRSALKNDVKIYKCPACGKQYQSVAAWIDHGRNIHRFACTYCEETLRRYFYFLVHMQECRPLMVPHVAKIYREMLAMDEYQYRLVVHPQKQKKKTYKSRNRPWKMHKEYIDKLREEGVIQPKKWWEDDPYDDETAWD